MWSTERFDVDDPDSRDELLIGRMASLLRRPLKWYFRPDVRGMRHVPPGPCLFVANHNGAMLMPDMFVLGLILYDHFGLDGLPWGLTHRLALKLPLFHEPLMRLGTVRGTEQNGVRLLREGRRVLVYPGGELDSMRAYRDRRRVVFGRRRGYVRVALRSGAPVVPVVTAGAHETLIVLSDGRWLVERLELRRRIGLSAFPLSLSVPWGLWLGPPPPHIPLRTRMKIRLLPAMRFDRMGDAAAADQEYVESCHRRIHGAMERTLERLVDGRELEEARSTR